MQTPAEQVGPCAAHLAAILSVLAAPERVEDQLQRVDDIRVICLILEVTRLIHRRPIYILHL